MRDLLNGCLGLAALLGTAWLGDRFLTPHSPSAAAAVYAAPVVYTPAKPVPAPAPQVLPAPVMVATLPAPVPRPAATAQPSQTLQQAWQQGYAQALLDMPGVGRW